MTNSHLIKAISNFYTRNLRFINILASICCFTYGYYFFKDLSPFWFHPHWTTDDALQQVFPFHKVFNPELFKGDLITETMEGYLAPLHYWLSWFITWLVGDPILMSHWLMTIQVVLVLVFIFLTVKHFSSLAPALISVAWVLHTRPFMQRMVGGLPRAWSPVILSAFLYFLIKRNHKMVLLVLLCGCLSHPPSTLIAAVTYGLVLLWGVVRKSTRKEYLKPFIILVCLSPFYALITFKIVDRPDHIGKMVTFEEASNLPELQRPHGRFPFTPLNEIKYDIQTFAFQPFKHRLYNPGRFWKRNMVYFVVGIFIILLLIGYIRKKKVVPDDLVIYLISIVLVYSASRLLAFQLYVPDRHLQFPMTIFLITAFSVAVWHAFVNLRLFYGKFARNLSFILSFLFVLCFVTYKWKDIFVDYSEVLFFLKVIGVILPIALLFNYLYTKVFLN